MSTDAGRSSPSLATDCKKIKRPRAKAGLKLLVTLAVIAGLATGSAVAAGESALKPIVIVLSWDGMRHDYDSRGHFPGLARMATQGVKAQRLRAVVPSNTFPGHVSMATGTYPDRHGIVDNRFFDRERGDYTHRLSRGGRRMLQPTDHKHDSLERHRPHRSGDCVALDFRRWSGAVDGRVEQRGRRRGGGLRGRWCPAGEDEP